MATKNIHTWTYNVNHIKTSIGVLSSSTNNLDYIVKILKNRFHENWFDRMLSDRRARINEGNKLRTLRKFKTVFKYEKYLDYIKDFKSRSNFCKFRISSHNLMIEIGRHSNIPVSDRICKKCELNEVEDEKHALMICPKHTEIRNNVFDIIDAENKNFKALDTESKFIWLLSNEDKQVITNLVKLINKITDLPRT